VVTFRTLEGREKGAGKGRRDGRRKGGREASSYLHKIGILVRVLFSFLL